MKRIYARISVLCVAFFLSTATTAAEAEFACANVNADENRNIGDAVFLLNWLFTGGPATRCESEPTIDEPRTIDGFTFVEKSTQGYDEYDHDLTGLRFVLSPGGEFVMGSSDDECDRYDKEGPAHPVRLSSFLFAKYELSQREWIDFMGFNPSTVVGDDLPVESCSWAECQEFNRRAGLDFPTEAQWEYVCRAGTTTPFYFGDAIHSADENFQGTRAYCDSDASEFRATTEPVVSFEANPYGIYNLHGNILEWCEDVFSITFYGSEEAQQLDPISTEGSPFRVMRGGCWFDKGKDVRSAMRYWGPPYVKSLYVGYRPAKRLGD